MRALKKKLSYAKLGGRKNDDVENENERKASTSTSMEREEPPKEEGRLRTLRKKFSHATLGRKTEDHGEHENQREVSETAPLETEELRKEEKRMKSLKKKLSYATLGRKKGESAYGDSQDSRKFSASTSIEREEQRQSSASTAFYSIEEQNSNVIEAPATPQEELIPPERDGTIFQPFSRDDSPYTVGRHGLYELSEPDQIPLPLPPAVPGLEYGKTKTVKLPEERFMQPGEIVTLQQILLDPRPEPLKAPTIKDKVAWKAKQVKARMDNPKADPKFAMLPKGLNNSLEWKAKQEETFKDKVKIAFTPRSKKPVTPIVFQKSAPPVPKIPITSSVELPTPSDFGVPTRHCPKIIPHKLIAADSDEDQPYGGEPVIFHGPETDREERIAKADETRARRHASDHHLELIGYRQINEPLIGRAPPISQRQISGELTDTTQKRIHEKSENAIKEFEQIKEEEDRKEKGRLETIKRANEEAEITAENDEAKKVPFIIPGTPRPCGTPRPGRLRRATEPMVASAPLIPKLKGRAASGFPVPDHSTEAHTSTSTVNPGSTPTIHEENEEKVPLPGKGSRYHHWDNAMLSAKTPIIVSPAIATPSKFGFPPAPLCSPPPVPSGPSSEQSLASPLDKFNALGITGTSGLDPVQHVDSESSSDYEDGLPQDKEEQHNIDAQHTVAKNSENLAQSYRSEVDQIHEEISRSSVAEEGTAPTVPQFKAGSQSPFDLADDERRRNWADTAHRLCLPPRDQSFNLLKFAEVVPLLAEGRMLLAPRATEQESKDRDYDSPRQVGGEDKTIERADDRDSNVPRRVGGGDENTECVIDRDSDIPRRVFGNDETLERAHDRDSDIPRRVWANDETIGQADSTEFYTSWHPPPFPSYDDYEHSPSYSVRGYALAQSPYYGNQEYGQSSYYFGNQRYAQSSYHGSQEHGESTLRRSRDECLILNRPLRPHRGERCAAQYHPPWADLQAQEPANPPTSDLRRFEYIDDDKECLPPPIPARSPLRTQHAAPSIPPRSPLRRQHGQYLLQSRRGRFPVVPSVNDADRERYPLIPSVSNSDRGRYPVIPSVQSPSDVLVSATCTSHRPSPFPFQPSTDHGPELQPHGERIYSFQNPRPLPLLPVLPLRIASASPAQPPQPPKRLWKKPSFLDSGLAVSGVRPAKMENLQVRPSEFSSVKTKAVEDARQMQATVLEVASKTGKDPPKYALLELIGKGSFGRVYKGKDMTSAAIVAVKIIDIDESDTLNPRNADSYSDFLKEVNALKILSESNARNINHVIEALPVGKSMWMISEHCGGGSVATLMKPTAPGGLQEKWIIPILREVAEAIKWVHQAGIIHRDIKCANVLITEEGGVQVCDFGVAGIVENKIDKRSTVIGTPHWMAPELFTANPSYGKEVDIWAFGSMVYEIATGLPPNVANGIGYERLASYLQHHTPRLEGGNYSNELRDLVAYCLEELPASRPTIEEVQKHPYIYNTSSRYPASSLSNLVRAFKMWEDHGGSRKSLFMLGGAQGPSASANAVADDEWNFSTTAAFDQEVLRQSTPQDVFEAYGKGVALQGFFAEETSRPPQKASRRRPPPEALARLPAPLEKIFDPNTLSNYEDNSRSHYGKPPQQPASDLPLRDDTAQTSIRDTMIDLGGHDSDTSLSNFPDMDTIKANRRGAREEEEDDYSTTLHDFSRPALSDPADVNPNRRTQDWKFPAMAPPASADPEISRFPTSYELSRPAVTPASGDRPALVHHPTELVGAAFAGSLAQQASMDRLPMRESLIDLDMSMPDPIPAYSRPSTANSDAGSATSEQMTSGNPFELERHASLYAPLSSEDTAITEPDFYPEESAVPARLRSNSAVRSDINEISDFSGASDAESSQERNGYSDSDMPPPPLPIQAPFPRPANQPYNFGHFPDLPAPPSARALSGEASHEEMKDEFNRLLGDMTSQLESFRDVYSSPQVTQRKGPTPQRRDRKDGSGGAAAASNSG